MSTACSVSLVSTPILISFLLFPALIPLGRARSNEDTKARGVATRIWFLVDEVGLWLEGSSALSVRFFGIELGHPYPWRWLVFWDARNKSMQRGAGPFFFLEEGGVCTIEDQGGGVMKWMVVLATVELREHSDPWE
jgi:hypothetical protein